MKIIFVTDYNYLSVGGTQTETRRLTEKLSKNGHSVWVIAPSSQNRTIKNKDGVVKIIGIKSYLTPFHKTIRFVPFKIAKSKTFEIFEEIKPDVIHVQTNLSLAKAASLYAKKYRVANIATGHYATGEFENTFKKIGFLAKLLDRVNMSLYKSVYKNVDLLTIPSKLSKTYFNRIVKDGNKIFTISNGVDLKKFSGKERKNIKGNKILFVGRLEPAKGVETIIRAMPRILSKIKAQLIIVGGGFGMASLVRLTKKIGVSKNVLFTGFASEEKVRNIYNDADLFVTASTAENQPIAVLEAIASGLPVIATKLGGIPELVVNGKNGYLFEPGDSESLAKHAFKVLADKRLSTQMGKGSREIAEKHDIDKVVFEFENLYKKAIALNSLKPTIKETLFLNFSKGFLGVTLSLFILATLFRMFLVSSSNAQSKGLALKNKIMNSKIVMKIENLDSKIDILRKAKIN